MKISRQSVYGILLGLGASVLLYRTLNMLFNNALNILVLWVALLLIIEMLIDVSCLIASIIWAIYNKSKNASIALSLGAAAAILHAFRVLIFVLGRTNMLWNFDVKPEFHEGHMERWTTGQIYFASVMSILGIIGVVVIWYFRKRKLQTRIVNP